MRRRGRSFGVTIRRRRVRASGLPVRARRATPPQFPRIGQRPIPFRDAARFSNAWRPIRSSRLTRRPLRSDFPEPLSVRATLIAAAASSKREPVDDTRRIRLVFSDERHRLRLCGSAATHRASCFICNASLSGFARHASKSTDWIKRARTRQVELVRQKAAGPCASVSVCALAASRPALIIHRASRQARREADCEKPTDRTHV